MLHKDKTPKRRERCASAAGFLIGLAVLGAGWRGGRQVEAEATVTVGVICCYLVSLWFMQRYGSKKKQAPLVDRHRRGRTAGVRS